jgi:hypothetical protein
MPANSLLLDHEGGCHVSAGALTAEYESRQSVLAKVTQQAIRLIETLCVRERRLQDCIENCLARRESFCILLGALGA